MTRTPTLEPTSTVERAAATMWAIAYDRYGETDVLHYRQVPTPTIEDDEVLVRVEAASVNRHDWHHMLGLPYILRLETGLRRPRRPAVIGSDIAGRVEVVGRRAIGFRPGDEVFADVEFGGCAEYAAVAATALAPKPATLSFEEAAAVPLAATTALQGLRTHGRLLPGQRVLINGATGAVGTFALQIARALRGEVTAVCSTRHLELVRSLGAHHTIDYTAEDFPEQDVRYDLIVDIAAKHPISACRRALTRRGTLVLIGNPGGRWVGGLARFASGWLRGLGAAQRIVAFVAKPDGDDLRLLSEMIDAGEVRPVLDRTFSFRGTAEAVRYVGQGHAEGKVVIGMEGARGGE